MFHLIKKGCLLLCSILAAGAGAGAQTQCSVSFLNCPGTVYVLTDCNNDGSEPVVYPQLQPTNNGQCFNFKIIQIQGPPPGAIVPIGAYTVVFQVQGLDAANNVVASQNCTFLMLVAKDVQPPVITHCPPNITVYGTYDANGNCEGNAYWTPLQGTDNCGNVSEAATNLPCGTAFGEGFTTVTHTITDPSGNTASCTSTVTVICVSNARQPGLANAPLALYPNPGNGHCQVDLPQPAGTGLQFRVLDATGKCWIHQPAQVGQAVQQIDTSPLPNGFYIIELWENDQPSGAGRWVKQE
jgi:hypothetical protein